MIPTLPQLCRATALAIAAFACASCTYRPAAFDLIEARRTETLAAVELPGSLRTLEAVTVREVQFGSTSWDTGEPRPIRIHAYVAIPRGDSPARSKPGVIFAHGLGGQADENTAREMARNLDVVALSLSGPGLGKSEGTALTPEDARALFAGDKDIRKSWLYAYVFAILRSITYLQSRDEVDPQAIAVTGFSLGGLATFVANGVDDRIRAALPVAAAGGLKEAAAADTWLRRLVRSTGNLQPTDPGPVALFRGLDPLAFARSQHGVVCMLTGAQDEYFPLPQAVRTFEALRAPHKSLSLFPDYDHGWYFGGGCPAPCMPGSPASARPEECPDSCPATCPADARPPYCGPQASYNREADFNARWSALMRALIAQHVAQPRRPFAPPPAAPSVDRRDDEVLVRTAGPAHAVRLLVSDNCGHTYSQTPLTPAPDGAYHHRARTGPDDIVFAEVESAEGAVTTSTPRWPAACPLRVRPFGPRP